MPRPRRSNIVRAWIALRRGEGTIKSIADKFGVPDESLRGFVRKNNPTLYSRYKKSSIYGAKNPNIYTGDKLDNITTELSTGATAKELSKKYGFTLKDVLRRHLGDSKYIEIVKEGKKARDRQSVLLRNMRETYVLDRYLSNPSYTLDKINKEYGADRRTTKKLLYLLARERGIKFMIRSKRRTKAEGPSF